MPLRTLSCTLDHFLSVQDETGPSAEAGNLVRQLVCAAVHSKAAYGHAMAAGHLSSLYNFALLQTVCTSQYSLTLLFQANHNHCEETLPQVI